MLGCEYSISSLLKLDSIIVMIISTSCHRKWKKLDWSVKVWNEMFFIFQRSSWLLFRGLPKSQKCGERIEHTKWYTHAWHKSCKRKLNECNFKHVENLICFYTQNIDTPSHFSAPFILKVRFVLALITYNAWCVGCLF